MAEDKEYEAMGIVIKALEGLESEQRERVFDYAAKRFSLVAAPLTPTQASLIHSQPAASASQTPASAISNGVRALDIRELKNTKKPKSDTQMAVLVAYYLKTTTTEERRDSIGAEDITTYFTQAGYPLPTGKNGPTDTLNNAKRAGYFESAGKGLFRLNPVGFNLAAYNMPTDSTSAVKSARKPTKKTAKAKGK